MIAEQRAVACIHALRQERSGDHELRCPPGTTREDMDLVLETLQDPASWYCAPPTKPAPTFDGPDYWLWSVVSALTLGWAGLLGWMVWRICHGAG